MSQNLTPENRDLLLKQYEYVQKRKETLNETAFKFFALFQTSFTALCGAQFYVLRLTENRGITNSLSFMASSMIAAIYYFMAVGCCAFIMCGVFSWIGYRTDQVKIDVAFGLPAKPKIRAIDFFKWFEFYFIAAIIFCSVIVAIFYVWVVLGGYLQTTADVAPGGVKIRLHGLTTPPQ